MPTDWKSHNATKAAIAKFETSFAKTMGVDLVRSAKVEAPRVIPTGSLALDDATGIGGYPVGRVVELWGPEHVSKQGLVDDHVLTPDGWVKYRDLRVGDLVIGQNGRPTEILGVYPQGVVPVSRVTFSDRSSIVVGDEHLWRVQSRKQIRLHSMNSHVWTTRELAHKRLRLADGSFNYRIPMVEPVQYEKRDLPLDPYLLGVLLANGYLVKPIFTTNDTGVVDEVRRRNPSLLVTEHQGGDARRWYVSGVQVRRNPVIGALRDLGLEGLTSHHKFVPEIYLRSTSEDRILLLQGLLDCDGGAGTNSEVTPYHHKGNAQYFTRSGQLACGVQELAQSLGGTASISQSMGEGGINYRVSIVLPRRIQPFLACQAKLDRWESRGHREPLRSIVSIEPAGEAEGICIRVAAEDHLYVTEQHIVTHNTTMGILAVIEAQRTQPDKMCAWVDMEQTFEEQKAWAVSLGLDLTRLWRPAHPPRTAEDVADATQEFVSSGLCSVVVLDSIGGMITKLEYEKAADQATVASVARVVTRMVKQCSPIGYANGTTTLVINQVRSNIAKYGPDTTTPGGWALKHITSMRLKASRGGERPKTIRYDGADLPVGYEVSVKVEKNKSAPYGRVANFWLFNRGTDTYGPLGVNKAAEAAVLGPRYGAVETKGAWYTLSDGERCNGNKALVAHLFDHPEKVEEIRAAVLARHVGQITEEPATEVVEESDEEEFTIGPEILETL